MAGAPRGTVEDVVDLVAEFTPRREQGRGVEIPLDGALAADRFPGLVEGTPPVHTDHVAARARDLVDVVGSARAEVDHRHTDVLQTLEEHRGVGEREAPVVREAERDPRPGVEHLERLGARARLRGQVVCLHGDELRHETLPRGGLSKHQRLCFRERLRGAPFDRVARERERRAGESDEWRAARLQLARDDADRFQCVRHGLFGGRRSEAVDVARTRDVVADARAIAIRERQLEAHADERRQNVGKDNGSVEPKSANGLQRHLGRKLRRANDVEDTVPLAQGPVLRHVAPRLAHEPDRCAVDGKPVTRS